VAVQTGPQDAQDGDDEQDGEGYIGADEGRGEDGGHDRKGGRGSLSQRGEQAGEGTGESRAHEGGQAERPDAGAGLGVAPAARLSLRRSRSFMSCCTRRRRIDPSAPIWLDPSFSSSSFLAYALISGRC